MVAALSLPEELTTKQAAELLNCCPKTVRRYIDQGALVARNAAPPRSSHRDWRIPLTAAVAMRNDYQCQAREKPVYETKHRTRKYQATFLDIPD